MNHKAVIFDLDGTLLDTLEDLAASVNSSLAANGYLVHKVEEYKNFVGNGVYELIRLSLPSGAASDENIKRCVASMREEYSRRWDCKTRPYDGIQELLACLSDKEIKMAVLSNKPDDFTKKIVERYFPDIPFAAVFGQRPSVPRKPDPAGAFEIADMLGLAPEEFLYLGDSGTDMMTANAAGMYAVGALWGFREAGELRESGAMALIDHPDELLSIFTRLA